MTEVGGDPNRGTLYRLSYRDLSAIMAERGYVTQR
jgi:transposase-like protein